MRPSNKPSSRSFHKSPVAVPYQDDAAPAGDAPLDIAALQDSILRKMDALLAERKCFWAACPRRACRRQKICTSLNAGCLNMPPRSLSEEERVEATAGLRRMLNRRLAELDAQGQGRGRK